MAKALSLTPKAEQATLKQQIQAAKTSPHRPVLLTRYRGGRSAFAFASTMPWAARASGPG